MPRDAFTSTTSPCANRFLNRSAAEAASGTIDCMDRTFLPQLAPSAISRPKSPQTINWSMLGAASELPNLAMHLQGLPAELQHVSQHSHTFARGCPNLREELQRRLHRGRIGVVTIIDDVDALMGHHSATAWQQDGIARDPAQSSRRAGSASKPTAAAANALVTLCVPMHFNRRTMWPALSGKHQTKSRPVATSVGHDRIARTSAFSEKPNDITRHRARAAR